MGDISIIYLVSDPDTIYFTQLTDRLMHNISLISFSASFQLVLDGKGGFGKETLVYKLLAFQPFGLEF